MKSLGSPLFPSQLIDLPCPRFIFPLHLQVKSSFSPFSCLSILLSIPRDSPLRSTAWCPTCLVSIPAPGGISSPLRCCRWADLCSQGMWPLCSGFSPSLPFLLHLPIPSSLLLPPAPSCQGLFGWNSSCPESALLVQGTPCPSIMWFKSYKMRSTQISWHRTAAHSFSLTNIIQCLPPKAAAAPGFPSQVQLETWGTWSKFPIWFIDLI